MKKQTLSTNWNEVQAIVSRYYGEWNDTSYSNAITTMLPSTALLGNGDVGVTSYGNDTEKTFLISKGDFWTYKGGPILIGGVTIGTKKDFKSDFSRTVLCTEEKRNKFYEKQDILRAEILTQQQLGGVHVKMKTWLSSDKNVLVTELTADSERDVAFCVKTWAYENDISVKPVTGSCNAESVVVTRCTANIGKGTIAGHVSQAALASKVIGATEVITSAEGGSGKICFVLKANTTVYVVTAIGGGGRTYKSDGITRWNSNAVLPVTQAQTLLTETAGVESIKKLNASRLEWWKDFWCASYIDFGTEDEKLNLIQRYYYGAQYLLGSTTKEGKIAPGLYGIWHTNDEPRWMSDYHMNYNFIATFYGTYSSNRPALSLPGVKALLDYMPQAQENASRTAELKLINSGHVNKKIKDKQIDFALGVKEALLFPVGIGPWGMDVYNGYYWGQLLDAAFNTYLMTEYYEYTKDVEFLKAGVYDFLKKVISLYEVWLEKEKSDKNRDGYEYVVYATFREGRLEDSLGRNPSVELSALKNTLRHLIEFSKLLNEDIDKREMWIDIYEHLAEQPIVGVDGKKVFAVAEKVRNGNEWIESEDPTKLIGGVISLESMIPGNVHHHFSPNAELQMIRNTIDLYSAKEGWSQINNFPKIFTFAVRARYDIGVIVDKFAEVIKNQMVENLSIQDRVHGVEKIGATEAVNNMCLITENGITKVFPNWLENKDARFVNLRTKGAFVVSADYNASSKEAENIAIISEAGEVMTFVVPWKGGAIVKDSAGNMIATKEGCVPNQNKEYTITFDTKIGERYTIEKMY